jgi:D-inositol-3-phosphate glycosyltransferase
MKIVLIGPVYPYRGGIAHHTAQLARALQERGHQLLVISFQRQYPAWLYPGSTDRDPSSQAMRTEAEYLLDPLYPWTWRRTTSRMMSYKPDLVVFQWWTTIWAFAYSWINISLRYQHIRYTSIIHNVLPHEPRPWDRWLARLALGHGQPLIAQNPHEMELLQDLLPNAPVRVCPHPIYPRFTRQYLTKSEARQKLDLPAESQILLFFGIVRPYKGLHSVLEALSKLRENALKPILIIAGEFWENKLAYLKKIDSLHLNDQVRIEDHYLPNEEADLYFSAADLLVAPYIGGTQSGAAALAIGYDLPAILTQRIAAGIPDEFEYLVKIVPECVPDALAQAIQDSLEHPIQKRTSVSNLTEDWSKLVDVIEALNQ